MASSAAYLRARSGGHGASIVAGWLREACRQARDWLPSGRTLPDEAWAGRHRAMLWVLWAHVVALPVFSLFRGLGLLGSIGPVAPLVLAAIAAKLPDASRRARSVA